MTEREPDAWGLRDWLMVGVAFLGVLVLMGMGWGVGRVWEREFSAAAVRDGSKCPVIVTENDVHGDDGVIYATSMWDPEHPGTPAQYDDFKSKGCVLLTGRYLNDPNGDSSITSTWAPPGTDLDGDVCLYRLADYRGIRFTERVDCPVGGANDD